MSKFQENLITEVHDFLSVLKNRDEALAAYELAVATQDAALESAHTQADTAEERATKLLSEAEAEAQAITERAAQEAERLRTEARQKAEELVTSSGAALQNATEKHRELVAAALVERRATEILLEKEQNYMIALIKDDQTVEDPTPATAVTEGPKPTPLPTQEVAEGPKPTPLPLPDAPAIAPVDPVAPVTPVAPDTGDTSGIEDGPIQVFEENKE